MLKKTGIFLFSLTLIMAWSGLSVAWQLPDTGQTGCYNNNQRQTIPCPEEGGDFYGQDATYETNPQSYTKLDASGNDLGDDATEWFMVRDNVTGLIWEVKTADNKDETRTWEEAETYVNDLELGGFSDWRLPTVKELSAIVKRDSEGSGDEWFAINRTYFKNTASGDYWTFTDYVREEDGLQPAAWVVDFDRSGRLRATTYGDKTNSNYMRAVRGNLTPSPIFIVDHDKQTVIDMTTKLMWQQTGESKLWQAALEYCETLSVEDSGYDDWRLPNIIELQSLVNYGTYDMAIDTSAFPNTSVNSYWSSTTRGDREEHGHKLYLSLQSGSIGYGSAVSYTNPVRCVRGPVEISFGLREVILALQAVTGMDVDVTYFEVSGDGKIGLEEVIYLLQYLAGERNL